MLQTIALRMGSGLLWAVCVAVVVDTVLLSWSSAQTTGPAPPPLVISSMYGGDLFVAYCASCHDRDGKGGGPAASALRVSPPDLTAIGRRHGGVFPREWMESFVTGNREPLPAAHGSKDMPVWGPIFRGLDANDRMNRARIEQIVRYLETLQQNRGLVPSP